MATQVQRRRGNTAQNNAFLGALGELAFNTELIGLRLHDGVTVGGHRIAMFSDIVSPPFADTTNVVMGSVDPTKLLRFEVDGFTTLTTRVLTPQNADYILAGTNVANNFSVSQLFGVNIDLVSNTGALRYGTLSDVILLRDAANTLALRNGTAAQAFNVYNTFTDASNYERGFERWSSNILQIGTEQAGTGVARSVRIITGGTSRWQFDAGGPLLAVTDNTLDIGASGASRPRNLFLGGEISCATFFTAAAVAASMTSTGRWQWTARAAMLSPADGVILFQNNALNDFNRLQFGGTTSSFPSLKRSTTGLQFRLADDSAYTFADALEYRASGTKVVGAQGAAVADAAGGATVDAEARTAINTLLARLRTHGLIAT